MWKDCQCVQVEGRANEVDVSWWLGSEWKNHSCLEVEEKVEKWLC